MTRHRPPLERWEVFERWVLVAAGLALIGWWFWLAFFSISPVRAAGLMLLPPCIYWVFWRAFFEDKLGSREPPSQAERVMRAVWLWLRRIVLGGIALLFLAGSIESLVDEQWSMAAIFAFLALVVGWVGAVGGGRQRSMQDDLQVHLERSKRYE